MAKHSYMMREDYVSSWRVRDALRELIANAIDAEKQQGAKATLTHHKDVLTIANRSTRLDVNALYLGGTNKEGSTQMIGQYGEGMKLALMVLTRNDYKVKIENDDEVWSPVIEPDVNGVRSFAINTRAKKTPSGNVVVTIEGVSDDLYYEATQMFLHFTPPTRTLPTSVGEIILDAERTGHLYVRGVFITKLPNAMAGYNVKELEVSRDRRSYEHWQLTPKIQHMWGEAATRPEAAREVFDGFLAGADELQGASWTQNEQMTEAMVKVFAARYGEDALPVVTTGEGTVLEHLGARGVVVPPALAAVLRRKLPTPQAYQASQAQRILERHAFEDLTTEEQKLFRLALHDLSAIGCDLQHRVTVVQFGSPTIEGLHQDEEILLARSCLKSYGKTVGVLLHEAAHDAGSDATKQHVDRMHAYMEALFTHLAKQRRTE